MSMEYHLASLESARAERRVMERDRDELNAEILRLEADMAPTVARCDHLRKMIGYIDGAQRNVDWTIDYNTKKIREAREPASQTAGERTDA